MGWGGTWSGSQVATTFLAAEKLDRQGAKSFNLRGRRRGEASLGGEPSRQKWEEEGGGDQDERLDFGERFKEKDI